MSHYRRYFIEGGTYFFTVKTEENGPLFADPDAATLLGNVTRDCKSRWPFEIIAAVLLPDHLHMIWSLPPGDDGYSKRIGWIKKEFTKRYLAKGGTERFVSASRKRNRRRGIWQRRFWEHVVRDEDELAAFVDYLHWNPVKHRHASRPLGWPDSSFHRFVRAGIYPEDWGRAGMPLSIRDVKDVGE